MSAKVIAIGMDAGDPVLLERWMDAGLLPGLAGLRSAGAWGRLVGGDHYRAEAVWTTLLTGCDPEADTDTDRRSPSTPGHTVTGTGGAYDYAEHPPSTPSATKATWRPVDVPQACGAERCAGCVTGPAPLSDERHHGGKGNRPRRPTDLPNASSPVSSLSSTMIAWRVRWGACLPSFTENGITWPL